MYGRTDRQATRIFQFRLAKNFQMKIIQSKLSILSYIAEDAGKNSEDPPLCNKSYRSFNTCKTSLSLSLSLPLSLSLSLSGFTVNQHMQQQTWKFQKGGA